MKISVLINMKMQTIVGIFIFISRENFMLSRVEHENSFITSGPGVKITLCLLHLYVNKKCTCISKTHCISLRLFWYL